MQGLPFDESDFPAPSVGLSSTWMDQSPRIIAPNAANAPAPVTEEDLYPMVAAAQPNSAAQAPKPEVMQRLSQHIPVISSSPLTLYSHHHGQPHLQQQQALQSQLSQRQQPQIPQHPQTNISPPPQAPSRGQRPRVSQAPSIPDVSIKNSPAAAFLSQTKRMPPQISSIPPERQRVSTSQAALHPSGAERVTRIQSTPVGLEPFPHSPAAQQVRHHRGSPIVASSGILVPDAGTASKGHAMFHPDHPKKPARSAVEEARLRAQQEAESFANSRRDPTKREAGLTPSGNQSDGYGIDVAGDRRSSKRARPNPEVTVTEGSSSRKGSRGPSDERTKTEEDSEAEKQERYKRRLDMNRESAAVSRVRRRAYVKELEERLAAVEAEKLQLEGKLEIMQSQNEGFKKQLDNLFMMVASGRRPQYPPPPQNPP